ncbi:MAG: DUF3667 domain-containing protein [Bacteroidetes bacterium]|nr:DUF3667 domain-containing protein [Bacteroidota bacterium]MBS1930457.1 DUF3667 domain-containing protein [Bacteroidota bacterium]
MIACKNCGRVFEGNYCSQCGQSANTKRLSWQFLLKNFEHEILHLDHGILFTIREILIRPGITINKFLEGKRKKYSHPFTYIAVISVIYLVLRSVLVKYTPLPETQGSQNLIANFIYQNYSKVLIFVFIPLAALFTPIFYPRNPYNFVELFTFQCYIRGQFMLFELLILFINWLLLHLDVIIPPVALTIIIILINMFFLGWAQQQFFNDKNYIQAFLKAIGITLLLIVSAMILVVLASLIMSKKQ